VEEGSLAVGDTAQPDVTNNSANVSADAHPVVIKFFFVRLQGCIGVVHLI
jgi:hypothetical protein